MTGAETPETTETPENRRIPGIPGVPQEEARALEDALAERFLRYSAVPSQSDAGATAVPSTEGQRELARLLAAELRAGLGEVAKCGLIADPAVLDLLTADPEDLRRWDSPVIAELIRRSVAVKADVVGQDPTEAGPREVLNYGHTYAHAIEALTDYRWRHGEAVAVGCVFAAEVARAMGLLSGGAVALHREVMAAAGLPTSFPEGADRLEDMLALMGRDKKVRAGRVRMVLLEDVALPRRGVEPDPAALRAAHEAVTAPGRAER